jgi:hypothetical protein
MSLRNWKDTNAKRALFVQWTATTEPEKIGKQIQVGMMGGAVLRPERFPNDQLILPGEKKGHEKRWKLEEMRLRLEPAIYREHLDLSLLINRNLKLGILALEAKLRASKRRALVSSPFSLETQKWWRRRQGSKPRG